MVGVPNPGTEFRGASTVTFLRMPAVGQPCPVFMWCRTVDIGAHHARWLVLQTLFMTASVPTATSTTRRILRDDPDIGSLISVDICRESRRGR